MIIFMDISLVLTLCLITLYLWQTYFGD